MAVYLIYACETTYEGAHGMNNWCVEECRDFDDACEVGRQMSYEVIDSYGSLSEECYEEARENAENDGIDFDSPEADEYIAEVYDEHVSYYVYKLKDTHTFEEYDKMTYTMDYEDMRDEFAEE